LNIRLKVIFVTALISLVWATPIALAHTFIEQHTYFSIVLPVSLLIAPLLGIIAFLGNKKEFRGIPLILLLSLLPLLLIFNGDYYHNAITFSYFLIISFMMTFAYDSEKALEIQKIVILSVAVYLGVNLLAYFAKDLRGAMLGNRNWFSALLAASIPCLAIFYNKKKLYLLIILIVLLIAIFFVLKQLSCKASYLALAFCPIFIFLHIKKNQKLSLSIVVVGLILAFLAPSLVNHHDIRFNYWNSTLGMIVDHPLLGVGAGNFEAIFADYVSEGQKLTLIYSHGTAHPHNEFLSFVAQYGIIFGLLWLFIMVKALCATCSTLYDYIIRSSLFILFIHGMFDKVLTIPPIDCIFYILVGLSLLKSDFATNDKYTKVFVCPKPVFVLLFVSSICLFFFVRQTGAEIYERKALNASIRNDFEGCYQLHKKSIDWAPWDMRRHYAALNLSMNKLKNTSLAQPHLEYILENQPYAGQSLILAGMYYEQMALENRGSLNEYLKLAHDSYERAVNFNLIDLKSHYSFLDFTFRYMSVVNVQQRYDQLKKVYKTIATLVEKPINKKITDFVSEIKSKKELKETLGLIRELYRHIKEDTSISIYSPAPLNNLHTKLRGSLNLYDAYFLQEMMKVHEFSKELSIAELLDIKIDIDKNAQLKLPSEVILHKKANQLSRVCLISQALVLKGLDNIIGKWNDEYFFVIHKNGKMLKVLGQEKFEELSESEIAETKFLYFCYPQSFYKKNELLAHVLSHGGTFPIYCKDPGLILKVFNSSNLFKKHRKKVEIITEYYNRLPIYE